MTFTIGYEAMRYNQFNDQLKQFHGNKARFDVGREWFSLDPEQPAAAEMKASVEKKKPGSFYSAPSSHIRNFLNAFAGARSRTRRWKRGRRPTLYSA